MQDLKKQLEQIANEYDLGGTVFQFPRETTRGNPKYIIYETAVPGGLAERFQIEEFIDLGLEGVRPTKDGRLQFLFSPELYNRLRGEFE